MRLVAKTSKAAVVTSFHNTSMHPITVGMATVTATIAVTTSQRARS